MFIQKPISKNTHSYTYHLGIPTTGSETVLSGYNSLKNQNEGIFHRFDLPSIFVNPYERINKKDSELDIRSNICKYIISISDKTSMSSVQINNNKIIEYYIK